MRNLSKKAKTIIAGAAIAGLASAGGAYAYWTTTGDGVGSATTGTTSAFVVTTDPATDTLGVLPAPPLTPGGPTQMVAFHVQNTNSGIQHLFAVDVTVAGPAGVEWVHTGCSAADYTVGTPTFTAGDIVSGGFISGTVTIQMINNTLASQDGCKGATVPLYVHAS